MNVAPFFAVCSELPNDNPALHAGAVWVPMSLTGRPRAISRPQPVAVAPPEPAAPEALPEPKAPSTPDAFCQLVSLLCRVALASGATRAAAVLPAFVEGQVVEPAALSEALCHALIASGHAEVEGTGIVMSESVAVTARAWRAVLTGQSDDLSSCEGTLDSWCADLVAALSGAPARASEVRRELRRFGVAAFGLLHAA